MLKLYDYFRSSASYRVRIALNLKKLDYETVSVHLVNNGGEQHSDQYQAINPQSLVPSLEDNGRILTQSLAIIEYLDETHPNPSLLPDHPYEKAKVRAFAYAIAADIHPVNNLRILQYLTNELHISEEQKNNWYHHWIAKGLGALEKMVTASGETTDFCFGDKPSLADVCLAPQMYNAKRFNCDLSAYPNLCRIDQNCQLLSAFTDAQPAEPVAR
jgi:maleylacetoacetate isomerase